MEMTPTRTRIIEAANAEFSRNGFYRTVVSDIADRAGVGKGTVYRHFGNKEDLFGFLIKQGITRLEERLNQVLDSNRSPVEALREVVTVYFTVFEESRQLNEIIVNEGLQKIGRAHDVFMASLHRIRRRLRKLMADGISRNIFIDRDPDKLALIFQGLVWSVLRSAVIYNECFATDDFQAMVQEVCLNGFLHKETEKYL